MKLVTHAVDDLASTNSRAVEELRREATRVGGDLTVYSVGSSTGAIDRMRRPLLHAKLVCVDETRLLLGSANLTSYGLGTNLEVGTILGTYAAQQASIMVRRLIEESAIVQVVFDTRTGGG